MDLPALIKSLLPKAPPPQHAPPQCAHPFSACAQLEQLTQLYGYACAQPWSVWLCSAVAALFVLNLLTPRKKQAVRTAMPLAVAERAPPPKPIRKEGEWQRVELSKLCLLYTSPSPRDS